MTLSPDLIVRPYNEIVDDVLVAMVGGVTNEPLIYSVREDDYLLAEPARAVRGITGTALDALTAQPAQYTFQPNIDWSFNESENRVHWLEKGRKPIDGSVFYVDYFKRDKREDQDSPLTDINVGSVTRTLSEAMSRELAVLYSQVNLAYQSGFIDLAKGKSLDFVVALLGVERKTADFAQGQISFFRTNTSRGNITIPQGVKLSTKEGIVFETTAERTIQRGQVRVDVPARATDAFKGPAGRVEGNTVTTIVIPIEGIDHQTNFDPMTLGAADETDEELRRRAKAVLRGLGQCTVDALLLAAQEARATNAEVRDPLFPPEDANKHTPPGKVVMVLEVEPERFSGVTSAVNARRAAGVNVQFIARYVYIRPRMEVALRRDLTPAGKDQVKQEVIKALTAFVASVGSGNPVKGQDFLAALKPVADVVVDKTKVSDLLVWQTVLDDGAQLGQRKPARDLAFGPTNARATDAEIEAGTFSIVIAALYWPVLEMEPADIQLQVPG